jgi:hypothetical protein
MFGNPFYEHGNRSWERINVYFNLQLLGRFSFGSKFVQNGGKYLVEIFNLFFWTHSGSEKFRSIKALVVVSSANLSKKSF